MQPSIWLAITIGWVTQLGLKTLLPLVTLVGLRFFSVQTGNEALWLENPGESSHPGWYVLQASVFAGSVWAGWLAGKLSPRKSALVPIALVSLSLLVTGFEQLPAPLSHAIVLVWAAGPCIGLVLGLLLAWLPGKQNAPTATPDKR